MNLGNISLEQKFERAVGLLCKSFEVGKERRKPILMHDVRVGMYLYEHDYVEDVVIAGLLHDVLEWSETSQEVILEQFGQRVLDIVVANTKDRSIEDADARRDDYIHRCASVGEDALIVKAADTLDSFRFYTAAGNQDEIARSKDIAVKLLEKLPPDAIDPIFEELRMIV